MSMTSVVVLGLSIATVVLLLFMQSVGYLAGVAALAEPSTADLAVLRSPSPVVHAGAALLLLLVAVAVSVYKPRGRTGFGR